MRHGDEVVLLDNPAGVPGPGVIADTLRDGRLAVAWPDDTVTPHDAHELELFTVVADRLVKEAV